MNNNTVRICDKFLLTIKEASAYFNIGENKMHNLSKEYLDSECNFTIQNGGRALINRQKFENFLNKTSSI